MKQRKSTNEFMLIACNLMIDDGDYRELNLEASGIFIYVKVVQENV